MAEKIVALSEEIELIQEEKFDILTPVEEKSMTVRGFLLDTYSGKLSFEQIKRLEAAISQRIIGKFQKQEFEKVLDRPFVAGGVGLNRRTAKKFSREVELIIMKR